MAIRAEGASRHTSAASAFRKLSRIVANAAGDRYARKAATEQAEVERQLWDKGATSSRSAAAARAERPGAQRLGMNDASGAVAIRPEDCRAHPRPDAGSPSRGRGPGPDHSPPKDRLVQRREPDWRLPHDADRRRAPCGVSHLRRGGKHLRRQAGDFWYGPILSWTLSRPSSSGCMRRVAAAPQTSTVW